MVRTDPRPSAPASVAKLIPLTCTLLPRVGRCGLEVAVGVVWALTDPMPADDLHEEHCHHEPELQQPVTGTYAVECYYDAAINEGGHGDRENGCPFQPPDAEQCRRRANEPPNASIAASIVIATAPICPSTLLGGSNS